MARTRIFYWDTSVFIALFNDEKERAEHVAHYIEEAENSEVVIITSSITPVEVIKYKGKAPIKKSDQKKLRGFLQKDYFRYVDLTRKIGELAQELIWDLPGLQPKDSIHLASAVEFFRSPETRLDFIHSYDTDFLKLNNKLPEKIPVTKPLPPQTIMKKLLEEAKTSKPKSN